MKRKAQKHTTPHYSAGQWRTDPVFSYSCDPLDATLKPSARDQSRLMDLLGRINYKILTGKRVYVEVGGVVYRTLFGGYWRSVFTGNEHYLLRCETIPDP